jgi:hypothetical protein
MSCWCVLSYVLGRRDLMRLKLMGRSESLHRVHLPFKSPGHSNFQKHVEDVLLPIECSLGRSSPRRLLITSQTLMSSSACTLPDSFVRFCSDQPASTFCWNVKVDSDSTLLLSNRTRAGLIQDVNTTAQRFLHSGPSRRRCGAPLVNVCFFARSGYDLFVGFLAALINRWTVCLNLFIPATEF